MNVASRRKRKFIQGSNLSYQITISLLIIGPCLFWQFFWMKHSLVGNYDNIIPQIGETLFQSTSPISSTAVTRYENALPSSPTLLNLPLIQSTLLKEAPWAESHGADHNTYLGGAMLYYAYGYAFQCKNIVVLGSGGGFVPRILKQAQRDLEASGRLGPYNLYLVDAHLPQAGWGSTFYADNLDTMMRQKFNDIHYIFKLTDDAYQMLKDQGLQVDYLHVDADHGFEQSWKDFDNYSNLLSDRAVISFHDTCRDDNRHCHVTGVSQTIDKVRSEMEERGLQLMDAHYLYRGLAFAIRRDAPALERPDEHRTNFCRNNFLSLSKSSSGFTLNRNVGQLATLGDFMKCETGFNMTDLLTEFGCPFGKRRNSSKGHCKDCIPGMTGRDCHLFQYANLRRKIAAAAAPTLYFDVPGKGPTSNDPIHLAAAWLATEAYTKQRSQHIFELGPSASLHPLKYGKTATDLALVFENENLLVTSHLLHKVRDVVAVDPLLIKQPIWTDSSDNEMHGPMNLGSSLNIERKRLLPIAMRDVMSEYRELLSLGLMDTFVCMECNDLFIKAFGRNENGNRKREPFLQYLESIFPNVNTVVFGIKNTIASVPADENDVIVNNAMNTLVEDTTKQATSWKIVSDVTMIANTMRTFDTLKVVKSSQDTNRLVMLSKQI